MPSVIQSLLEDRQVSCSHGAQIRDFLHVEDVALAFQHLLENDEANGIFNISSGMPISIRDLVMRCVDVIRPEALPDFGADETRDGDPPLLVGNNSKLKQFGWKPEIPIEGGIALEIQRYKAIHYSKNGGASETSK